MVAILKKTHSRVAGAIILVAVVIAGGVSQQVQAAHGERHYGSAWFELGGYYNSDDASRGEGILFAPLSFGENGMLFTDIRMKFFEDDVREGNFALGYRHMTGHGFNYGVWIGADIRESAIDNSFHQLSGGFEALSHNLDFRLNWYGPGTDAKAGGEGFTTVAVEGNNIFMIGGQEVMLQGVDGEIGIRLPVEVLNVDPNKFELRAYGGGFHFDDDDALEEVAGGKARVTLAMNDIIPQLPGSRLTAEYEFSYDDVREERHEVGGRLRIPLSDPGTSRALSSMSHQERRMMDGLERDTDIITTQSKRENVEDALTNTDFDRVAFVNNGGSIEDTSATAGDNSLLIVNGTIDDGAQQVQANQTVQGGGSTIQVRGLTSGTVVGFTAAGSRPTVTNGGGNVLRLLGDNTHIAGLLIDGQTTNNNGIAGGGGKTNIAITQNIIQNTGNDGINFGSNNNLVQILDNVINNAADEGIDFDNRNTNITISGVTISNSGDQGIDFDNRNTGIVIADTTITNSSDDGIDLGARNVVSITGVTIDGAGDDGIDMERLNTVTIADSTITNASFGIFLSGNLNNVDISNTVFSNLTPDGVLINGNNNEVTIAASTFNNIVDVFQVNGNDNTVLLSDSSVTNISNDVAHVDGRRNLISFANVDVTDVGNDFVVTHARFNEIRVVDSTITNVGQDVFDLNRDTTLLISGTTINGTVGDDIFDFDGPNSTVLAGSTGNVNNATVTGDLCEGNGNFTGTLEISGIVIVDGGAPCI